jgi:hypothetical protein
VKRYFLLCLLLPALAAAAPSPGDRARVTLLAKDRLIGTLRAFPPGSLTLAVEPDSTERTIPYASIAQLEILNGTKSRWGLYALVLGVVAAVPGAIVGHNLAEDLEVNETEQFYFAAGGAVAFGLVGAGIGALIGKGDRVPRWEVQPLP